MKDLLLLLTFRDNKILALVMWACVITAIVFAIKGVQSHRELNHLAPEKKPWRYHYDVITANERAFFSSDEKMILSERGNIIDMQGGIHFENAKSIRLIEIRTDENGK